MRATSSSSANSRRLIYSFTLLPLLLLARLPDCSNSDLFCKSFAPLSYSRTHQPNVPLVSSVNRETRAHEFCCEKKTYSGTQHGMAAPAQQSQQQPSAAPKTRLGLSLAERIKVIEARQMGKSMRQVVDSH